MDNLKWKVIGRGFGYWHATTDDCMSEKRSLDDYVAYAEEGALVYDAREANQDAFCKHVSYDPMLATNLPPGGVDRNDKRKTTKGQIPKAKALGLPRKGRG
jgi:hypothetical protein